MPRRLTQPNPRLNELRQMAGEPEAQSALAVRVLAEEKDVQAVRAALEVLEQHPTPAARPVLRERYAHYDADGLRRDVGGYLRAAIVRALRHIGLPEDLPVLERAASTYEFLPPTHSEEASLLRSAALVTMEAVDPVVGAFHAIRLLGDPYTSRLSGEPAVTAVRVLAAQDEHLALFYYALYQPAPHSDVLSECLKNLTRLPRLLLPEIIKKYAGTDDEVVLVGLLDLVLDTGGGPLIREFMDRGEKLAVYRYLVTRLVASHTEPDLAELSRAAQHEQNRRKLGILEESLGLGRADPIIVAALAAVRGRIKALALQASKE